MTLLQLLGTNKEESGEIGKELLENAESEPAKLMCNSILERENMATTADEVWKLLGELIESQKETERKFQETERFLREQS
ncbi:hypothetical protein CEP08_11775, partial [Cylindrospermopsis raciborskii S05]